MALPPSARIARPSSTAAACGAATTPRRWPAVWRFMASGFQCCKMSHVLGKECYDTQGTRTTTSQKGRRMSSLRSFAALTAGAFAIAALSFPSFAGGPRDRTAVTTEFSAESKPDDKNKKVAPKGGAQKQAPVRVAPRVIERHVAPSTAVSYTHLRAHETG